jgi:DNA repair protein RecO (recombination protein O)
MGPRTAVEGAGRALGLAGDALLSGFYLNELLLRLTGRQDPNPALFDVYNAAVVGVATAASAGAVLRVFEKRLLDCLGYGPPLRRDPGGAARDADAGYLFPPHAGSRRLTRRIKGAVSGRALLSLAAERLSDPACLAEARRITAKAIDRHLGGRPLHTRQVLLALRRGRTDQNKLETRK